MRQKQVVTTSKEGKRMNFVSSGMFKSDGEPFLCKCGKQATSGLFGQEAYVAWCEHHSPMLKQEDEKELVAEWGSDIGLRYVISNKNDELEEEKE